MNDRDPHIPPSKVLPVLRTYFKLHTAEARLIDIAQTSGLDLHLVDLSRIRLRLRRLVPFLISTRLVGPKINTAIFDEVYTDVQRFKVGDPTRSAFPVLFLVVGGDVSQLRQS